MKSVSRAIAGALLLTGASFALASPAAAQVDVGISFGDPDYAFQSCDYYDYYDEAPPWGLPSDYCDYPVYFEPVYFDGYWYRGPIYYRWNHGRRLFWLNGGWREDGWRGPRPGRIAWSNRGGHFRGGIHSGGNWHGGDWHGGDWHGRDWHGRDWYERDWRNDDGGRRPWERERARHDEPRGGWGSDHGRDRHDHGDRGDRGGDRSSHWGGGGGNHGGDRSSHWGGGGGGNHGGDRGSHWGGGDHGDHGGGNRFGGDQGGGGGHHHH